MQSSGQSAGGRAEIVFVDTGVDGYETIVESVGPHAAVVLIDAGRDGFVQMAEALAGREDLQAIHIVGHGEAGVLMLGSALLHIGNLYGYAGELGVIGRALAPGGDIQLWGCDVGASETGRAFVLALAEATGADIAASDDLTGAGGDWTLEVTAGSVAASAALDMAKLEDFQGDLSGVAGTIDFNTADQTALAPTVTDGMGGSADFASVTYQIFTTMANGSPTGDPWRYYAETGTGADGIVADDANGDPVVVIRTADGSEFSFDGIQTSNYLGAQRRITFEGFRDGASTGSVTLSVDDQLTGNNTYTTADLTRSVFQNVDEVRITNPDIAAGGTEKVNVLSYDDIVFGEAVTPPVIAGDIAVPADATYVAGETLSFTVTFDENVTVTGTSSTLALTIGGTARSAAYASKTANSITYSYTVQAGDADADGVAISAISLNGSTIRDWFGNDADLSLAGHLPSTAGVLVDAAAPAVSGNLGVPANGSYGAGQTLSFTITFDENVTVTGTDSTLGLTIGSTAREATFASKTANSITYSYTVQAGDTDANGVTVGGVTLGATTIRDGAGNDASLTLGGHLPSTAGVLVDTSAPAVASVSVPANATYAAGQHLDFTVAFGETVTVSGTDSALGLTIGGASRSAGFLSSSGATVTYRYTVQAGDMDADGVSVGGLSLGATTIRDGAGNNADLTLNSVGSTAAVLVDADAPAISGSIAVPASATYVAGQTLSFTVTFDENVTVTGTSSTLALTIGGTARSAAYASKTANSITYSYTVQAGDADADGVAISAISLNGSTIRDGSGNNADLTLAGHVPSTAGVLVDAAAPAVSGNIGVPANGSYGVGQTLSFTITFDENVTVTGTDSTLGLTIGGTAREATFASKTANSITYSYTVQAGDTDANGVTVGGVTLGATTIRDGSGNDASLTLGGHLPSTAGVLVDTAAPAVASVSVPANATYAAGQHLDFTVAFGETVTVSGTDSALGLTIGGASRSAGFLSSSGATVTYRYTVQAGDMDADGVSVGGLSLGATTIRDGAGNNADLTLNSVGSTAAVLVDADAPAISGSIAVPASATYVAGQTLSFTVTFDENVTVTGTDSTLALTIGGSARSAAYASKTANSITYSYTVQAGDADADGVAVGAISLNATTIRDGLGNNADLSLVGHLPSTAGVLVDAVGPSFVSASVNGATLVMTYSDGGLLDAAHAPAAGAFTVQAGGVPVAVTAVAVNGAARTITLTLASPVAPGAAVSVAYGDPSGGDDANAIQDVGGNDALSLAAVNVTNNTPTPTPTPPPTQLVDGVPVQSVTGAGPDGAPTQTLTIPVVPPTRQDQVGNNQVADIPLVRDSSGSTLLGLQVPVGYGLTASGPTTPKPAGDSLNDLIGEIRAHTSGGSQDQSLLAGGGAGFVGGLSSEAPLLVQTIVTTAGAGAAGSPLVISGAPTGAVQTALVIDTSSLPSGVHLQLQDVGFAAIIGAATVTGGAGSQHVWGDGASQSIFLGAEDDVLHGGGGDDTVGSATGDDELYGDDGEDVVFGGEGADFVHGNAGNDTARGDVGDDRVYGGKGEDQVFGGGDNDLLFGDLGQDTLQGNTGRDTLDGGDGADLLFGGQDNDVLFGGAVGDLLSGDKGDDLLQGNGGGDTLHGGTGNDQLHGGRDNDVLFGDDGDDLLSGDLGDDIVTGGAGADLFVTFAGGGMDRVLDFNLAGGDRVALLAGTAYSVAQVGADTVISLTGGGQFTLVDVQMSGLTDGWITMV